MFKTQDIIGDVVFISFNDGERYKDIGIKSPMGHFKVLGYDNVGIWVSHPYLIVSNSRSKDKNQKNIELESNFLITWDNIRTIMHYPDREGFDFPSEFDRNYGFKSKK